MSSSSADDRRTLEQLIAALPLTQTCRCGHLRTEHAALYCGKCPGDDGGPWCDEFRGESS